MAFQFTPLREGRPISPAPISSGVSFQFTPLREGRRSNDMWRSAVHISIHAPPRGATEPQGGLNSPPNFNSRPSARGDNSRLRIFMNKILFQFTPLREGRLCQDLFNYPEILFQFTPLREGRRFLLFIVATPMYFNSRPSARGDKLQITQIRSKNISIHAPPRGATA